MAPQYFKFKGKVHLWKYLENQSNFPGINLTADKNGCDSMIKLLTLFNTSDYQPTKTLNLHPTTQVIASVGMAKTKFKNFTSLTLKFVSREENVWTIQESLNDEIKISFSSFYLEEMKAALDKIKVNKGDFLIADKKRNNILWF